MGFGNRVDITCWAMLEEKKSEGAPIGYGGLESKPSKGEASAPGLSRTVISPEHTTRQHPLRHSSVLHPQKFWARQQETQGLYKAIRNQKIK